LEDAWWDIEKERMQKSSEMKWRWEDASTEGEGQKKNDSKVW
jgi:hypothetical protein